MLAPRVYKFSRTLSRRLVRNIIQRMCFIIHGMSACRSVGAVCQKPPAALPLILGVCRRTSHHWRQSPHHSSLASVAASLFLGVCRLGVRRRFTHPWRQPPQIPSWAPVGAALLPAPGAPSPFPTAAPAPAPPPQAPPLAPHPAAHGVRRASFGTPEPSGRWPRPDHRRGQP